MAAKFLNQSMSLFLAQDALTQFGAGIMLAACSWDVLAQTGSNSAVAAVNVANTLSGLLISMLGGSIVDRFGPKVVSMWSHVLRFALTALPLLLQAVFGFHLVFAMMLMISNGIGWNVYYPASKSLIQRLTAAGRDEQATKANSFAEISMQVGLFSSGAVAGTLYWVVGYLPVIALSGATFVVGALLLHRISLPAKPQSDQTEGGKPNADGFWHTVLDGFRHLALHPALIAWCLVLYTPFIIGNLNRTLLPGYALGTLQSGSVLFGFIQSTWGVGACLAGITASRLRIHLSTQQLIMAGLVALCAFGVVLAVTRSIPLSFLATFIAGFADAIIRIVMYTWLMGVIKPDYFGRVISVMNAVSLLLQTILTQVSGTVMDRYGASSGFLLVAMLSGAMILLFIVVPLRK